ncbi:hypothetical protein FKM82_010093 [Ascaphus truei]
MLHPCPYVSSTYFPCTVHTVSSKYTIVYLATVQLSSCHVPVVSLSCLQPAFRSHVTMCLFFPCLFQSSTQWFPPPHRPCVPYRMPEAWLRCKLPHKRAVQAAF